MPKPVLNLHLPAAILRSWSDQKSSGPSLAEAELFSLARSTQGIHLLEPGKVAITPESGDPAVFDTALHLAERILEAAASREPGLRLLILPGQVQLGDGTAVATPDVLIDDAAKWFAQIPADAAHITGWAALNLELPRELHEIMVCSGPAGRQIPVLQAGSALLEKNPWRNPELLNRKIKSIARQELLTIGEELLAAPAVRIEGPVGCGKSHLAHHLLAASRLPRIWLRGYPEHRRRASLSGQLLDQLQCMIGGQPTAGGPMAFVDQAQLNAMHRPDPADFTAEDAAKSAADLTDVLQKLAAGATRLFFVIVDDLELCNSTDLETLVHVLKVKDLGARFKLLLIGRGATALPEDLANLPRLTVGPFNEREMSEFSPQLFAGLSLPSIAQNRLHAETQGCPFALEEGMIALIRQKSLRRHYGGFFFAGQESAGFSPSPRLLCHLQAEVHRLGIDAPAHLLALIGVGAPASVVGQAAGSIGLNAASGWQETGKESGMLQDARTPWGDGVAFACDAFSSTLCEGIETEVLADLRQVVGGALALKSDRGKAHWESYRLLRGTPAAIQPLARTLESDYAARIPRQVLLEVLNHELYRLRERSGDAQTELLLLWKLLPLARKAGKLNEFASDLDRGVELARDQPKRLLALAGLKAELDQDAGRYKEAEATIRLALEAAKGADERRQALLLLQLGRLLLDQERYEEARKLFQKLSRNLDQLGLQALSASCRYYLGNISLHEQSFDESLLLHREALDQRRRQGLNRAAGNSLTAMGAVYLAMGNYPTALQSYREALELLDKHGQDADRAFPLLGLGRTLIYLGDYTSASRPLRQALGFREGKDDIAGEAVARLAVAENQMFLGQLDRAQEEATKALFQLNLLSRQGLLADAEQLLGRIQARLRQAETANRHLTTALERHQNKGNKMAAAYDLAYLLEVAVTTEDEEGVAQQALALNEAIERLAHPELAEPLNYQLYRGFEWLKSRGRSADDPVPCLERAYRELFRKASHLKPELRHHFLFQISAHRDIVEAAARAGLATDA